MGIRTNDELGGTIGGDTTGTNEEQSDGSIKRGLDINILDKKEIKIQLGEKDTDDQTRTFCLLESILTQLQIMNTHLSIISVTEVREGDLDDN